MMLIKFNSLKFYTTTLIKKEDRPDIPLDKDYESVASGCKKVVVKHNYTYWLPISEIKILKHEGEKYFVNDIEVSDIEFYAVMGMIENEKNPVLFKYFKDRDFKIVEEQIRLNVKENDYGKETNKRTTN